MGVSIEIVEPRGFVSAVADEIQACIDESIQEKGSCSLVLSGGKTPASIYRNLGLPPRVGEIEWDKVKLYLGDERWVPAEDNKSNYKMIRETLLSNIGDPKPSVHIVDTSLLTPDEGAEKYEQEIRSAEGLGPSDFPVFDIVLLGVGTDGHTASIFPNTPALKEQERICCAVSSESLDCERVTMTPKALFSAKRIIYIVKGEGKAQIVKRVFEGNEGPDILPAKLYETASGKVACFLDTPAASMLDGSY